MTQNRMGSTRRSMHRKAWVTGALALGVVAATGAVASAHESGDHGRNSAPRSEGQKHEGERGGSAQKPQAPRGPQGPACLKLDSRARQAISEAGDGTAYVPMDKVQIVPCPAPQGAPQPAPVQPAPPAPAPVPHVTTTAS
ncbi:MAG TPA: hypothetical protein VFP72_10860 [Kineosporiaceae bacterium]|nr:hypothetical protein [Kineosporiaceae bacterium]